MASVVTLVVLAVVFAVLVLLVTYDKNLATAEVTVVYPPEGATCYPSTQTYDFGVSKTQFQSGYVCPIVVQLPTDGAHGEKPKTAIVLQHAITPQLTPTNGPATVKVAYDTDNPQSAAISDALPGMDMKQMRQHLKVVAISIIVAILAVLLVTYLYRHHMMSSK